MLRALKRLGVFLLIPTFLVNGEEQKTPHVRLVEEQIMHFRKEQDLPGIAIALVINGKGYLLSYGLADKENQIPVTENTLFELASVTKIFTSTELALEVLRGRLRLSDKVGSFLPALSEHSHAINYVTLKDLATHTSSLPRMIPHTHLMGTVQKHQIIHFLNSWKPAVPIGTQYLYSNLGFGILGIVLVNVEKMPYQQLLERDILGPLEMRSTMVQVPEEMMKRYARGYSQEGRGLSRHNAEMFTPSAGALKSTSADMLKFLQANLGLKGPEELLKAMQLAHQPLFKVNEHLIMALGWERLRLNNVLTIDKNGGLAGFSTYIGFMPELKTGIVILINKSKSGASRIGRSILTQLSQGEKQNLRP